MSGWNTKKLKKKFQTKKLTTKFIFFYLMLIAIPVTLLSVYTFNRLQTAAKVQLQSELEHATDKNLLDVQSNIEVMDKMSRTITQRSNLKQYIIDNKNVSAQELLFFYNYFISDIQSTLDANPKIHRSVIFLNEESFLEQWPIVYSEKRILHTAWKEELDATTGDFIWKIHPKDFITNKSGKDSTEVIGLFRKLKYGNIPLGYVETTMKMSDFLPEMYQQRNPNLFVLLMDEKNGNEFYFDATSTFFQNKDQQDPFFSEVKQLMHGEAGAFETTIHKENVSVTYRYIAPLEIYLLNIIRTQPTLNALSSDRNMFILFVLILVLILCFVTYKTVFVFFKKLDLIMLATRQVRDGNINPEIPVHGNDEMGELAEHLRRMLGRIQGLLTASLKNQELTKNAEIKALQSQINAHFIHNTLESIKMMAEMDDHFEISDSITALGKLIRYSMNWKVSMVHFGDEMEYVENYVKLLNIRHDYQIHLIDKVDPMLYNYKILKMTIQPIIENAIQHGINPVQTDAVIKISGEIVCDTVIFEISDSGVGMSVEKVAALNDSILGKTTIVTNGTGIGLKNIAERIRYLYGEEYGMEVLSKEKCYTKVRLRLPLEDTSQ